MQEASTCVGLDVHTDSIDVTVAEARANGEVRHYRTIGRRDKCHPIPLSARRPGVALESRI